MRALVSAILLSLLVGLALAASAPADEPQHLRVLFVGNSLTGTNDLPAIVAGLARSRGRFVVDYRTVAPGGVNLEDHWNFTGARGVLEAGRWDVVVLQQGPSALPESQVDLRRWAARWSDAIRAQGAKPALLTVWPEDYRRSYAFGAVIQSYRRAAVASHAQLLPAGTAWRAAWRRAPGLRLYGPDGFHPSPIGTTLAALVVYAGLTGERPASVALPGVPPATARTLRLSAAEALAAAPSRIVRR
jgi:hypothetical protein